MALKDPQNLIYTENEIAQLIREPKEILGDWRTRPENGHIRGSLDVSGSSGSEFCIKLRQNLQNPLDFSVILAIPLPTSNRLFHLLRYNGRSHRHRNRIERNRFFAFHIHTATARYQAMGYNEDGYAESTERYAALAGALACLVQDAHFNVPFALLFGLG